MPKSVFRIDDFSGGMNSGSDPRDIAENEVSLAVGVNFDKKGRVRIAGGWVDTAYTGGTDEPTALVIYEGSGLFIFQSDYRMFSTHTVWDVATTYSADGYEYLVVSEDSGTDEDQLWIGQIDMSNGNILWNDAVSDNLLPELTTTDFRASIFFAEGGLRISSVTFPSTAYRNAIQFHKAALFNGANSFPAYPSANFSSWSLLADGRLAPGGPNAWNVNTDSGAIWDTDASEPSVTEGLPSFSVEFDVITSGGNILSGNYDLWYSFVYVDGSESNADQITFGDGKVNIDASNPLEQDNKLRIKVHLNHTANTLKDARIIGGRIYWTKENEAEMYLLLDIHFEKGFRKSPLDEWNSATWTNSTTRKSIPNSSTFDTDGNHIEYKDLPITFRYEDLNEHKSSDEINDVLWKCATVSGRRAYIGNVKMGDVVYGDRILASPLGRYDAFPESNFIDVATNDGDSITALYSYGDRLFQFKKKILYIVNVEAAGAFVESSLPFMGVVHPGAVCNIPIGLAWVNEGGCYMFDGEAIRNLIEKNNGIIIGDSTGYNDWATEIGTNPVIGYDPTGKRLIVLGDSTARARYFSFHLPTATWSIGNFGTYGGSRWSNFVNSVYNKALLIIDDDTNDIIKWSDSAVAQTIDFRTRDFDFGIPNIKKKIYKIYITYKVNSSTVPTLTTGIDGDTTPTDTVVSGFFVNSSGSWSTISFVPHVNTKSCYSMQIKLAGSTSSTFEINDMSLIYRVRGIK